MAEQAEPRTQENGERDVDDATDSSVPSPSEKRGTPVVWPRDLNASAPKDPIWGTDPKALRNA